MYDSTHRTYLTIVKFKEAEGRMVVARGLGGGGMESYCSMERGLQFYKFWRWMAVMVAQQLSVFNAMEPYT